MSTFENKVTVVTEFLQNRAALRRLTNHSEVGAVAGQQLAERGMRRIDTPVRREKIVDVLRAVDDKSIHESGFMLSALVAHFWDNDPGHRFFEAAIGRGLLSEDADAEGRAAFHAEELAKVYEAFGGVQVPDDASELDTPSVGEDRIRAIVREELANNPF